MNTTQSSTATRKVKSTNKEQSPKEQDYGHPKSHEIAKGIRMPVGTITKVGDFLQGKDDWIVCSNQEAGSMLTLEGKLLIRPLGKVEVELRKVSQILIKPRTRQHNHVL